MLGHAHAQNNQFWLKLPGKLDIGLHFGKSVVGRNNVYGVQRLATLNSADQIRLFGAPERHAPTFIGRQYFRNEIRTVHVQSRCQAESAQENGHAGAIAQQHVGSGQRSVIVGVGRHQVHGVGVDEPQHCRPLGTGQGIDQSLFILIIIDHAERADNRLPFVQPGQGAHQLSSRLERTHSTWRLSKKPMYKGIFFTA